MKKLLTILVFSVLFAACTKTDPFENVFDMSEDVAIAPVEQRAQLIAELNADTGALRRILYAYDVHSWPQASFNEEMFDFEKAIIINAPSELLSELPEIDFEKYTLVVGQFLRLGSTSYLNDQRIVIAAEGAKLYLNIQKLDAFGTCDVYYMPFASLYPKMPDMPVEVISSTRINFETEKK